ncbi:hypothetical protein DL89DRAFT_265219 [Linderina pennispora]|uniref:DUF6593 domain-containing protein n=1 Tax=Linderina pennispora TaxID=61395 RepID=A0A1Y1WIA9_9FUNG|nr:uncharacterized protein DL89DRAFT_265219 [Linderina pennispora]ORX73058.1 hypothetical protein DL89DRAFT_265219 [Linderina pennispora]
MSENIFTIVKRKNKKGWNIFGGHIDTTLQVRIYGQLGYLLDSQPTKITLSAAIGGYDSDDDERTMCDIDMAANTTATNYEQVLLVAESEIHVSGFAAILGPGTRIDARNRVNNSGWKFTDASGTKYKWTIDKCAKLWKLHDGSGNAVAAFNEGLFDTQGLGHLSMPASTDQEMMHVILITWGLVARGAMNNVVNMLMDQGMV